MVNCDILWFISLILEGVLKGLWNLGAKGAPGWYPYFYRDRGKSLFLKWPFISDGPHKFFDLCHCQKLSESLWKRCYLRKLDMNNFYYGHCSLTLIFKIPTWFSIKNSQCLSALLIILVLEKVKMHYWSVQWSNCTLVWMSNQIFKSWMDSNLFILYLHLQFINFTLIAPQHRVIYVGCTTFVWLNVLCIYKRLDVNSDVFKT